MHENRVVYGIEVVIYGIEFLHFLKKYVMLGLLAFEGSLIHLVHFQVGQIKHGIINII